MGSAGSVAAIVLALTTFVSSGSSTKAGSPAPQSIDMQSRPDTAGDRYRFVTMTTAHVTGDQPIQQTNKIVFDVEVVSVGEAATILRYAKREVTIQDDRPHIVAWGRAWIDVPIVFEASPGYQPRRILNWPEAKAAFSDALSRDPATSPGDQASARAYLGRLEVRGHDAIARELLASVSAMARVQAPRVMVGRYELPVERFAVSGGELVGQTWLEAAPLDSTKCEISVAETKRMVSIGLAPASEVNLDVMATVSTYDGWVLRLTQREIRTEGAETFDDRFTITRLGPAPGCGVL